MSLILVFTLAPTRHTKRALIMKLCPKNAHKTTKLMVPSGEHLQNC